MGCDLSTHGTDGVVEVNDEHSVHSGHLRLYEEISHDYDGSVNGLVTTEAGKVSQAVSMKLRVWQANRKHGIDADPNQFDPGRELGMPAHEAQRVRECITTQFVSSVENVSFGIYRVSKQGDAAVLEGVGINANTTKGAEINLLRENTIFVDAVLQLCHRIQVGVNSESEASQSAAAEFGCQGDDCGETAAAGTTPSDGQPLWLPTHLQAPEHHHEVGALSPDLLFGDGDVDPRTYEPSNCDAASEVSVVKNLSFFTPPTSPEAPPRPPYGRGDGGDNDDLQPLVLPEAMLTELRTPQHKPDRRTSETRGSPIVTRSESQKQLLFRSRGDSGGGSVLAQNLPSKFKYVEGKEGGGLERSINDSENLVEGGGSTPGSKRKRKENASLLTWENMLQWQRICKKNTTDAPSSIMTGPPELPPVSGGSPLSSPPRGRMSFSRSSLRQPILDASSEGDQHQAGTTTPSRSLSLNGSFRSPNISVVGEYTNNSAVVSPRSPKTSSNLITTLNGGKRLVVVAEYEIFPFHRGGDWGISCGRQVKKKGEGYYMTYGALLFTWVQHHLMSSENRAGFLEAHRLNPATGLVESIVRSTSKNNNTNSSNNNSGYGYWPGLGGVGGGAQLPSYLQSENSDALSMSSLPGTPMQQSLLHKKASSGNLGGSSRNLMLSFNSAPLLTSPVGSCPPSPAVQGAPAAGAGEEEIQISMSASHRGSSSTQYSATTGGWIPFTTAAASQQQQGGGGAPVHCLFSHFLLAFCPPAEILASLKAASGGSGGKVK